VVAVQISEGAAQLQLPRLVVVVAGAVIGPSPHTGKGVGKGDRGGRGRSDVDVRVMDTPVR
jgi:hypothetical protein